MRSWRTCQEHRPLYISCPYAFLSCDQQRLLLLFQFCSIFSFWRLISNAILFSLAKLCWFFIHENKNRFLIVFCHWCSKSIYSNKTYDIFAFQTIDNVRYKEVHQSTVVNFTLRCCRHKTWRWVESKIHSCSKRVDALGYAFVDNIYCPWSNHQYQKDPWVILF